MLRSSRGFHTLTLKKHLYFYKDKEKLIEDFKNYHCFEIYKDKKNPRNTFIRFNEKYQYPGIEWKIRSDIWDEQARAFVYMIEVKVNPKILGGIHDYLTAATYEDMSAAIKNFDSISSSISSLLGTFKDYELKRIDYCINFAIDELAPGCTSEQIMYLIKHGDIPKPYVEWKEYDTKSHRQKANPNSFYLVNKSITINCYRKVVELQERIEKGDSSISLETLDTAQDIIRFEVQCKPPNVYTQSRRAKANGNNNFNLYKHLLSRIACIDAVHYYYNKIIGKGDWYTFQEATRIIRSHHFNRQKEKRLITALRFVNDFRSVAKAKEAHRGDDLDAFKRTLKDLHSLGINPVTIPQRWGIKHIPNLLYAYVDKVSSEELKKDIGKF